MVMFCDWFDTGMLGLETDSTGLGLGLGLDYLASASS